jgi:hypothetical protein
MATAMEVIERSDEAGISVRHEFNATEVTRAAETAIAAVQAQQKAMIEARMVMAIKRPRSWDNIRAAVLNLCKTTAFAEEALYVKPIGTTPDEWKSWSKQERLQSAPPDWPRGFSVRFIEAVLFEAGNFDCPTAVLYEDEDQRKTQVCVWDLERNSSYSRTITTTKTVERKKLKNRQVPIGIRANSYGDQIYILPATDDEVNQKEASAVSKAIRTLGEKLLPPHHKAEWRREIEKTIANKAIQDPEAAKKEIQDAFFKIGVIASDIEKYLGHAVAGLTPSEYVELRGVYVALAAGDVTWAEAMQAKQPVAPGEDEEEPQESEAAKKIKARIEAQRKKSVAPTATQSQPEQTSLAPEPPPLPSQPITAEQVAEVAKQQQADTPKFGSWPAFQDYAEQYSRDSGGKEYKPPTLFIAGNKVVLGVDGEYREATMNTPPPAPKFGEKPQATSKKEQRGRGAD